MEYYEMELLMNNRANVPPKRKKTFTYNKKFIIVLIAILFFVLLIALLLNQNNDPNSIYYDMENQMINKAKEYIQNNPVAVSNEIYLDSYKLNIDLNNECDKVSGVFYNGIDYTPYLKCTNYESKVVDNNNQKITLNGDSIVIHAKGIPFHDPGYVSSSNVEVAGFVGENEGVYNLYYYVKDDHNFLTRKIVVIDNNLLKERYPNITLKGESIVYAMKGKEYYDEGVTASDSVDGDITSKVLVKGEINVDVLGKQTINYSITNSNGYQNEIERTVYVVDPSTEIYFDYKINPTNKVNGDVTITINVSGEIYEYMVLPSGEKNTNNIINYKVDDNGTYKFLIYDKTGNITGKEIAITNIDKDPPRATCDAVVYTDYTKVDVFPTSNKPISTYEYQINNMSMKKSSSSSYSTNIKNVTSAIVVVEDSVGNKSKVTCEVIPYNNWKFDYSKMFVYLKNSSDNTILKKYDMAQYLKGVVYLALRDVDFNSYSNSQLSELFKTFFVLKKAELLSTGKYSIYTKQLIYKIEESNYCDIYSGCKLVVKNGKSFYMAGDVNYKVDSDYGYSYKGLSENIIDIMNKAYESTKKEVVISNSFDEVLVKYTSSYVYVTDSVKRTIINDILSNKNYREVISKEMSSYKIYNITSYSSKYSDALKQTSKFFWPVGSAYADYRGLFTGTPESTTIIYDYGASSVDNKIHDGISIKGTCGSTKVIASKAGKVTTVGSSSKYGDYVTIQHDNGVSFLYGSLLKSSIKVKTGDTVKQGQLIGNMGNTNGTCMLYIEAYLNGTLVNPNEYISVANARPAVGDRIIYVEGGTVKRSVCLTLLASGFSVEATAGIMANIERESNFNLRSLGDGGTSIGLCQWHNTRYTRLSNHCGDKMYTTECQLDYLVYELKNNYKSTYEYLLDNYSAYEMAHYFCFYFEVPAAKVTSCPKRGDLAKQTYVPYVLNNCN